MSNDNRNRNHKHGNNYVQYHYRDYVVLRKLMESMNDLDGKEKAVLEKIKRTVHNMEAARARQEAEKQNTTHEV